MLSEAMTELCALKLGPMAERLRQWVEDPNNRDRSHAECVLALAQAQAQVTANKRARCFLTRADLPPGIAIDDFRDGPNRGLAPGLLGNLKACDWVQRGQSVVITGGSQTGKTFLAAALGREAALSGMSVLHRRIPDFLMECAIEKDRGNTALAALFKRLSRPKLLVLDDFAVELATVEQSHLIRRLLDARARHNLSVLVAASNAVEDWGGYFEDPTAADAIYGRLLGRGKPIVLKHPVA
jgi:DNA replication protein DnaC